MSFVYLKCFSSQFAVSIAVGYVTEPNEIFLAKPYKLNDINLAFKISNYSYFTNSDLSTNLA